jgi:hypothetical protein
MRHNKRLRIGDIPSCRMDKRGSDLTTPQCLRALEGVQKEGKKKQENRKK